jgi:hypothetical protein
VVAAFMHVGGVVATSRLPVVIEGYGTLVHRLL